MSQHGLEQLLVNQLIKLMNYIYYCIHVQLCLTLCDPVDCSPSDSSVYGIFQARILEWVAISFPGDLPSPGIELTSPESPALTHGFITTEPSRKPPLFFLIGV